MIVGELDTYAPDLGISERHDFGTIDLESGEHRLRITITGKSPESNGIFAGIDYFELVDRSPSIAIQPHSTFNLAEIEGPGAITHIWMTTHVNHWDSLVLRFYWDDEETPSVEVPYGDFFCNGWRELTLINSLPITVAPNGGMNSYWEMPFRKAAKVTIENLSEDTVILYYQIDYTLTDIPEDVAYFHAQWRGSNPLPYKEVHTLLDGVKGRGHYVGTYIAWGVNNNGWWGEGEVKFFMDGDGEFPTICGTGTEDYFGGAWNWDVRGEYRTYSTPYLGLPQVIKPDGLYRSQQRFGMYRWHVRIQFDSRKICG